LICRYPDFQAETIRVHDVSSGKPLGPSVMTYTEFNGEVMVSPDGTMLATLARGFGDLREGAVRLWQTATGKPHGESLVHEGEATCMAFSADGRLLATGGGDGGVRFWDVASARPHGAALWHAAAVVNMAFSPDGNHMATLDEGGTARLWQVSREMRGKPALETGAVAFTFGSGGKWLAWATEKTIQRWDLTTLKPVGAPIPHEAYGPALACSPVAALIAAPAKNEVMLWDVSSDPPRVRRLRFDHEIAALAFTPDGKHLAAMGNSGSVQMWNSATGKPHDPPFKEGALEAEFFDMQISSDGKLVATRCTFGLFLWRTDTGKRLDDVEGTTVLQCAMSADGKVLVADLKDEGKEINPKALVTKGLMTVRDPFTRRTLATLHGASFSGIPAEFSPDGKLVFLPDEAGIVEIWEVDKDKQRRPPLRNRQRIQRLQPAPDNRHLVTVAPSGTLKLWDISSGQQLGPAWRFDKKDSGTGRGDDPFPQVAFSPDARWLGTLINDGLLRLWPMFQTPASLREMELRTWLAVGARIGPEGSAESIPGLEWQELLRESRSLEKAKRLASK
jgi:WD40 repeat protein